MTTITKTSEGIYVKRKLRGNFGDNITWNVNKVIKEKYEYGQINVNQLQFPKEYIGKRIRLKVEII